MPDAFRNVSRRPLDLNDGRVIAPGDSVRNVDTDDEYNARLIDEGALIAVAESSKRERPTTSKEGTD